MFKFTWIGVFIGGLIGQAVPALWGGDTFSISASFFSMVFGAIGLWFGYKADKSI